MPSEPRIDRIDLHWGHVPVDLHFSYGHVQQFAFTIFRLGAEGHEGVGEVLLQPESSWLKRIDDLVGLDPRRLDALLPADTTSDGDRIFQEGLSIALHDLVGQISGLPLHALLGGKRRDQVPLMPCVFPTSAQDAGQAAELFLGQGFKHLKVKLVGNLDEDRARTEAIRAVAPEDLVLQGDANEGYETLDTATQAVKALGDAGLDLFEDPLKGDVPSYRRLREACDGSRAKVMVDALARRTADLVQVLRQNAADVINIHPDQPGSLSRVMEHARIVQAFGVPVSIGGTGYTAVGTAAYQHLTSVVSAEGSCGELGGAFDHHMPQHLVTEQLLMKDGAVSIPDTPGLGVRLDTEALSRYEEGHRAWAG